MNTTEFIKKIVQDIFKVSFISLLALFLIEQVENGFVADYFNLNYLLILSLVSGIICVIIPEPEKSKTSKRVGVRNTLLIIIVALIVAMVIFWHARTIGYLSYFLAVASFVIISILGINIVKDQYD